MHRDLKPENVLVTADGHAKVADFGIAKAIGQVQTEYRTATGQIVGTPAYMAPEQITGGEITPQADLYAIGALAYELLAGRHPFHDTDAPMALLMHHVSDEPPSLASVRPDLPPGVVAWVHAMLAKYPAARPAGRGGGVGPTGGSRVRRARAALAPGRGDRRRAGGATRAAATEVAPVPPSERSGIYPVVVPPLPCRSRRPRPHPLRAAPSHSAPDSRSSRRRCTPTPCSLGAVQADAGGGARPAPSAPARPPARSGRRAAPRDRRDPLLHGARRRAARGATPAAGPSLEQRVRAAVTPRCRAEGRVSRELSSLVPGGEPRRRARPRRRGAGRDRQGAHRRGRIAREHRGRAAPAGAGRAGAQHAGRVPRGRAVDAQAADDDDRLDETARRGWSRGWR